MRYGTVTLSTFAIDTAISARGSVPLAFQVYIPLTLIPQAFASSVCEMLLARIILSMRSMNVSVIRLVIIGK